MCVKFGWAEADITPTVKIALCGQFYERVTDEVETPISVTALAIESGGEQVVFCSCDLEGVNESLVRRSRQKLNAPGLDPRNVIINAVHTHIPIIPIRSPIRTWIGKSFVTVSNISKAEYRKGANTFQRTARRIRWIPSTSWSF